MRALFGTTFTAAVLVSSMVLGLAPAAHSAPITFNFTGSVSTINDPLAAFVGIAAGTAISGSYTFESTTADANGDATVGRYPGTLTAFSLTIGGVTLTFVGNPNQITVNNNNINDSYSVFAGFTGIGGYSDIDLASMGGQGPSTMFANDSLPLTPSFFGSFTQTFFNMQFFTGTGGAKQQVGGLTGTLSGLTQQVPEPGSLALLGLGLLGLGLTRRKAA